MLYIKPEGVKNRFSKATELELAHQLQQFGATVPGLDQYVAWLVTPPTTKRGNGVWSVGGTRCMRQHTRP